MIAHLTDLHLSLPGERPRGIGVNEQFSKTLTDLLSFRPELLVITGDLCLDTGNLEVYRLCREFLDRTGVEYQLLPGNHDDPELMDEVFEKGLSEGGSGSGRFHRRIRRAGEELVLFDLPAGEVREEDLSWLERNLQESEAEEILLFMHYPPIPLPVSHMEENYPLRRRDEVARVIRNSGRKVYIFCGHYHAELAVQGPNCALYLTPSTFFQITPLVESFAVDHRRPAWRFIQRYGEHITTGVRYGGA
ncbi:MAG: metallophosphoesterase family protein [Alkalispirochaetaceae bacterium]